MALTRTGHCSVFVAVFVAICAEAGRDGRGTGAGREGV